MNQPSEKIYAVLTGDIVGSSKLERQDREKLLGVMHKASQEIRAFWSDAVPMDIDIFRGDSWQMLIEKPEHALEIAVYFRAYLKSTMQNRKLDSRIVIATGTVDFIGNRVSESDGQAFRDSGKALEKMPRGVYLRYISDQNQASLMDAAFRLLDAIIKGWTAKQALAVTGAIQGLTQEKIAKLWNPPISQPTVLKHLDSSGWFAIENVLKSWKQFFI